MVIMLKRKMLRDIRKNLSQFITIFLMVMIGIMAYSGIKSYMDGMSKTADKFYSENNLFDLNVVGNLNHDDLKNIKSIDNVKDAELKLSVTAITDNDKTLLLNFIESNNISKFFVFEGFVFFLFPKIFPLSGITSTLGCCALRTFSSSQVGNLRSLIERSLSLRKGRNASTSKSEKRFLYFSR